MTIDGIKHLESLRNGQTSSIKVVFNEQGAVFFPVNRQHSDMKLPGVSYEDDYKGNALAAMIRPDAIEIRYHEAFSDQQVARIIRVMCDTIGMSLFSGHSVTYQGRALNV